jgi:GNAT superfamily N-acetyltransferase
MTSRFFRRVHTFRESLRWRSPFILTVLTVREIFSPLLYWHAWHVFESDLSKHLPPPYPKEESQIKIYTAEEILTHVQEQISGMGELQPADIDQRVARGDSIAIAYIKHQPAGYMWMSFSSRLELAFDTYWIVRPGEAVRYGSYVIPAYRGRGMNSFLNSAVNSYLREHGIIRTLASISVLNLQSLSLPKHYNKAVTMTVFLARIRGVNWIIRKSFRAPLESRFSWAQKQKNQSSTSTTPSSVVH